MSTAVFFLGSHPALSAAELVALDERLGWNAAWDTSRLPVALFGEGALPSPADVQPLLGGTTMIGTLRATFAEFPSPDEVLEVIPELQEERQGKRTIGVSAFAEASVPDLPRKVRTFAMDLKRTVGRKGTRIVFPPAKRSDLSTAQLLHNHLPLGGIVLLFLVAPERVDLVTIDTIQNIESYARRDRGRPYADPGRGMLPPKVAQMLINLSLVPPGGMLCDPFCGVGTIPTEARLMGLRVTASDASPTQVERTQQNLAWLAASSIRRTAIMHDRSGADTREPMGGKVFVHDVARGAFPLPKGSVDAIVTEGWLGPARSSAPLPREADMLFDKVGPLLGKLFQSSETVVKPGGRVVVTVPAFRVKKRLLHFPLEKLRVSGWKQESLVPDAWRDHPLFRDAARGTLLYGRPDAIVLREIVRMHRVR